MIHENGARFKNVLLIDDDPIFNIITRKTLERTKFAEKITTMTSAVAALQYLHDSGRDPEKVPDIIFLDIRMPGMSGFEFLSEYEKMPEAVRIKSKILILSSSDNKQDIEQVSNNPYVYKFLSKPLEEKQVALI